MANTAGQSIPKDKFLYIAINLLHRQFIAAGRTQAKRAYNMVREGKVVAITAVKMEDDSTVRFMLSLDHSEFKGHLNFGAFRAGLSTLLGNISRALQDKREVTVFNMEQRPGALLFGVTGVTVEKDQPCVMVLGADLEGQPGTVTLRLMYLDPDQFGRQGEAVAAAPGRVG